MWGLRMVAVAVVAGLGIVPAWAGEELATINGQVITKEAFQSALEGMPPQMQERFATPEGKEQLLDSLVTQEVLFQESQRVGLEKEAAVQSRLTDARRQILVEALMQKLVAEDVSDAKVKEYYDAHKADFRQVKASHILVETEEQAKDVKKRVTKKGADFAAVAKETSTDPSAKENGGDLGFFTKDQMVKPFADKAFAMKVKEISDPVKSEFGYHIIKVEEIKEAEPVDKLDPQALNGIKRAVLNNRVEKLKSAAKIVMNKDGLK